MNFTNAARNLLKHWEAENGIPNLEAYQDTGKRHVWTIGWGHTGKEVVDGLTWTVDQCEAALDHDLKWAKEAVEHGTHGAPVDLSDNQYSALVIFCFNIGVVGFLGSTVLRDIKAGRLEAVPNAMRMWNEERDPSGVMVVDKGLVDRREKEIMLWETV